MTLKTSALIIVCLTVFLIATPDVCRAQSDPEAAGLVAVSAMPATGCFWSMQLTNCPPFPADPFPDLPLYTDGAPDNYYYDDLGVDYPAYWAARAGRRHHRHGSSGSGGVAMTQDDVSLLPGGDGSTNFDGGDDSTNAVPEVRTFTPPAGGYTACETWTNFWLKISAGSGGIAITISNTLPGMSYYLLEKTNLNDPDWVPVQTLTATGNSIAASPVSAGTNHLYFAAALTANDQPPLITVAPSNQVVAAGGSAVFSVTAAGLDLNYQWQLNGTNLPGKTASTLTIASVQTNDAGAYTVIVSNVICWESATAGLGLIWSNYLGAALDASPAIAEDGSVFIATTGSMLFALDVFGNVKWSHSIATGRNGDITSSAALSADGSALYIGAQDSTGGDLDAFNPTNGALLWQINLGALVNSSPAVSATDGTIYVTTTSGNSNGLFSINPATHAVNWLFQTDDYFNDYPNDEHGVDSSPAVGPDCSVYFLSCNDLFAVNPDGNLAWFFPLPSGGVPNASPALDAAGNVIIGSSDGYVYCIGPNGGLQWVFDTGIGSTINSSIAVGPDGLVVAANLNGNLFAITNGALAWQFNEPYGYPFLSSPAICQDGVVVIGSGDNSVYGIAGGSVKWSYPTGGYVLSSPAINPADGGIIIAGEDGFLYKLAGSASPAANAPWPMFHANPRHTGATPNPVCSGGAAFTAFPNDASINAYNDPITFSFNISGTSGTSWQIYSSSDLTNWALIGSAVLDPACGCYLDFTDPNTDGVTNRFYQMRSGNVCSQIIGFINVTIPPGTNLIANQLYQVNGSQYPQNTARGWYAFLANSGLYSDLPDESLIMKWNGYGFDVDAYAGSQHAWLPNGNITLLPGHAEFFVNPTDEPITLPFAGLMAQGVSTNVISRGTNFVSSIVPQAGRIHSDLGYNPNNGDKVLLWKGSNYSTNTYTIAGGWNPSEPSVNIGQGFVLVASQTNSWVENFSACQPGFVIVPAYPLWTDTGIHVNSNDIVSFPATNGTWTGDNGQAWWGPGGNGVNYYDTFVTGPHFSLIAFVGPNPYYAGATNEWGNGNYFPRQSGANGYWYLGANGQFTSDRAGELWLGFNDDAVTKNIDDNFGFVAGQLQITGP